MCDDSYFIDISKLYSHVFFPLMDLIDLQRAKEDPTLDLSMTNDNIFTQKSDPWIHPGNNPHLLFRT